MVFDAVTKIFFLEGMGHDCMLKFSGLSLISLVNLPQFNLKHESFLDRISGLSFMCSGLDKEQLETRWWERGLGGLFSHLNPFLFNWKTWSHGICISMTNCHREKLLMSFKETYHHLFACANFLRVIFIYVISCVCVAMETIEDVRSLGLELQTFVSCPM